MHQTQEVLVLVFVANDQTPEVLKPGKQTLYLPPPLLVAPELAPILSLFLLSVPSVRGDHLIASLKKGLIQRLRVVSLVSYQALGLLLEEATRESRLNKGDLVR